jgi:4-phosphopantoate--beta-alanine ligase
MVALSRAVPAPIEINLFHRSPQRLALVAGHMRKLGARELLGIDARKRLPGLAQPRSWCSEEGIYSADAVLVSLEDGDRAQALKRAGKFVIAIDLNPLSRTAVEADVTIVDEVTRAVPLLTRFVRCARSRPAEYSKLSRKFDNRANLSAVKARMARRLAED